MALDEKKTDRQIALTPEQNLVFVVGEALEYCAKNDGPWTKSYPYNDYAEVYNTLADLLENPSRDTLNKLVEMASKVYGHRDTFPIIAGIMLIIMGSGIGLGFRQLLRHAKSAGLAMTALRGVSYYY